jgi:hypothetical protein
MAHAGAPRPAGFLAAAAAASLAVSGTAGCAPAEADPDPAPAVAAEVRPVEPVPTGWTPIFNGRDLTGWTPKIRGSALGVDSARTFRVEDGLLTVSYEGYTDFGERFGHLFYDEPLSHYRLRIEYRFVGDQAPGGAAWALENSGVMFHAQAPESMLAGQDFPISLEAQFLGGNGVDARPTANLCTPGTHVEIEGRLVEEHCIPSSSGTIHDERWVSFELTVLGDSLITHVIDGDTVLSYARPVVGGGVVSGFDPQAKRDGARLTGGFIALQSESHPIQFRRVLLQRLDGEPPG